MLSILIPIYNVKVVKLVDNLLDQCKKAKINFEIICLDDKSDDKYRAINEEVNGRFSVNYVTLSDNIGRARIRNRLCKLARYDWLLFLDCDSRIPSKKFIKSYIRHLGQKGAYLGGIIYDKAPPRSKSKLLHWHYGHQRESLPAKKRNRYPSQYFHSSNFVISRDIMMQIPFDEEISTYGYEDLALGQRLIDSGISLIHIDNPIIHKGLKKTEAFLTDQVTAINNLAIMYLEGSISQTRLIKAYQQLKNWGIDKLVIKWIERNAEILRERLISRPKNLYRLDLLKLLYFDKIINNTLSEE